MYGWSYDVYLSFRGKDTRTNFTSHLYNSLHQRGIRTFFDCEELRRGEEIRPSLVKAIKKSRIAIIVFSPNYASSSFCLDELHNIFEYINGKDQLVWPIFYNVDPSDIRHLRGSFKDSLDILEKRFKYDEEKVLKWRLALQKAANLSGDHLKFGCEYEHEFIGRIVEEVSRKVNHVPLHVADNPIQLETPMLEVISLLDLELDDRVKMVGIYGIGGIGKSTIARAVYNHIFYQFKGACFLADVRENSNKHGLVPLQETLLGEIVDERNIKLGDVHKGILVIIRRLKNKKILLILDDVDRLEQLQMIAGGRDWFGYGSRVIITTRDKHLLSYHGVDSVYEVKELNQEKALELFSWNAFKSSEVDPNFLDLSNCIVFCAGGLPLALQVMGSNLFGKRIDEWGSALDKYESIPSTKEIHEILKVSYDGLDDEEKEIFLDIACCFQGESLNMVKPMLDACGFHTEYNISVLIDKCLLKIDFGHMRMHHLIQKMGEEIVRLQSTKDVSKRSRLWSYKDIVHVLEENMGSDQIEVIIMDPPEEIKVHWKGKAFKKMKNLRILIVRNTHFSCDPKNLPNSLRVLNWRAYPSLNLPCDFHGRQLVMLKLWGGCLRWDKPMQEFRYLTLMEFESCDSLQQIPDLSGVSCLKELYLRSCNNLIEIHDSVGFLKELKILLVDNCMNLSFFPRAIKLPSLTTLPEILEENENELTLAWHETTIEELPTSIQKLVGLRNISLDDNGRLNRVPSGILMLPHLWSFSAKSCTKLHFLESSEGQEQVELSSVMPSKYLSVNLTNCHMEDGSLLSPTYITWYHVNELDLSGNNFKVLPATFKQFLSMKKLCLDYCEELREIEGFPPNVLNLSAIKCTSLSSQSSSMLVRQAVSLEGRRTFILPGKGVPKWFHYTSNAATMSFWCRSDYPEMTFCFVGQANLEKPNYDHYLSLNATVNGRAFKASLKAAADHMIFYNLVLSGALTNGKWKYFEIRPWLFNGEIKSFGFYANKRITRIKGIRFGCPCENITVEDILSTTRIMFWSAPATEEKCTLLDIDHKDNNIRL